MAPVVKPDNKFLKPFFSSKVIEIENYKVLDKHTFDQNNYQNNQYKVLKNITFESDIFFDSVSFNYGVKFINCSFRGAISINNCTSSGINKDFNFNSYNIILENCNIHQLTITNSNIERGIAISSNTVIEYLEVYNLEIQNGTILFDRIVVKNLFDICNLIIKGNAPDFRVEESTIQTKTRFESIKAGGISMLNSVFEKDLWIWGSDLEYVTFNNGHYYDDVYIYGNRITSLTIFGDEFKRSFEIKVKDDEIEGNLKRINIARANFGDSFILNGDNRVIEEIDLTFDNSLAGTMQFSSCLIEDAIFSGQNINAFPIFYYCQFARLYFNHLLNFGNISFISCCANSEFKDSSIDFYNSTLGKVQFNNFDFNSFRRVVINDSQVQDILTNGVNWFEDAKLKVNASDTMNFFWKKRELYRQLKFSSDKQGDRIQYLEFKARELRAFRSYVKAKHKSKLDNDRISLLAAETNDYGLNWKKSLGQFILITVGFYPLIIISASDTLTWLPAFSIEDFLLTLNELWKNLKILPQLINPARILQRMFPVNSDFGFGLYFWDGLHRLILAFYLFQIVSAFRKYVR